MIGCKPLCFFGEAPPRQERTKKKPYAGGNRAGTACGQTDTEEEPGKLAERTSQSFVCQVVRRKSAERCGSPAATSKGHWPFEAPTEPTGETGSLRGSRAAALPSGCDAVRHILLGDVWTFEMKSSLPLMVPMPRTWMMRFTSSAWICWNTTNFRSGPQYDSSACAG